MATRMRKQKQMYNAVVNQMFICCEQNGILPVTVYKSVETVRHYSQCVTEFCFSMNSLSAERRLPFVNCRPGRFTVIPQLDPRVTQLGVNDAVQLAPQVEVCRSEIG
jgi:hypothetical protein